MHGFHGIQASHAGPYLVSFSYASDNDGRTAYISVNGTPDEVIGDFPRTGGWQTMELWSKTALFAALTPDR